MTEYIIIVGLIAVALIAAVAYFGQRSKETFAQSGTALAGTEEAGPGSEGASQAGKAGGATASPRTTTGKPGSTPGSGSGGSAAGGTGQGGGGDAPATPGIVGGGGGKLSTEFEKAPQPDPYVAEDDSPWEIVEIPEEADTDALAAFAGKVDAGRGSGQGGSSPGSSSSSFSIVTLLVILLVAVAGAFVLTFLMKKG